MRLAFLPALAVAALACSSPPPPPVAPLEPAPASAGPASVAPVAPIAAEPPNPPAGQAPSRVETRSFASAALGVQKRYVTYLPRGYDDSAHRFPVVYLLHGLGGNETNWTQHGKLRETADAASFAAIVVMPDGDDGFYVNRSAPVDYEACLKQKPAWDPAEPPASYCVRSPRYEDYLVSDLVTDVDAAYRTRKDRRSRGIGGLSMGGFGALSLAMRHPDVFSAAASHSGMAAITWQGPALADSLGSWGARYPKKFAEHVRRVFGPSLEAWRAVDPAVLAAHLAPGALALHLDCGTSDEFHFEEQAAYLHKVLDERGIAHEYALVPGGHTWQVWNATLPKGLAFFAAKLAP